MMTTESFAADRTNLFDMTFRFLSGAMLSLLAAIGRTSPVVVMTFKGSEFEDLAATFADDCSHWAFMYDALNFIKFDVQAAIQ